MWLRHFAWRKGEPRFEQFVLDYWAFHEKDIARLCEDCHTEIHGIYYPIICRWASKKGKCASWTWKQADELIKALTNRFEMWVNNRRYFERTKKITSR